MHWQSFGGQKKDLDLEAIDSKRLRQRFTRASRLLSFVRRRTQIRQEHVQPETEGYGQLRSQMLKSSELRLCPCSNSI